MKTGRVYDESDGTTRVLVDRLWPRGIRKDDPRIDVWAPDVAPSSALRKWYGHEPSRHAEFCRRYERELSSEEGKTSLSELRRQTKGRPITLVTASKDLETSHVPVLAKTFARARG